MKYIRTRDAIRLSTGKERTLIIGWFKVKQVGFVDKGGKENWVNPNASYFKTSDNIEELFDCFVISEGERNCVIGDMWVRTIEDMWVRELCVETRAFYGAIWIKDKDGNPILKSVAEMNDKGEWELI